MFYVCPTPIGNLEDITLRTLRILKEVDIIACEDTRHTLKLLNHYEIKNKLISLHEHNEVSRVEFIIENLKSGKDIALVSDAGMPGISDPGSKIIEALQQNNIEYTVLPGPSASITAAVASTLCNEGFLFIGFLPRKIKEQKEHLSKYIGYKEALIIYESPHRIKETLININNIFGDDRKIALVREISKKYEEIIIKTSQEIVEYSSNNEIKGELIIIVEGNNHIEEKIGTLNSNLEEFILLCQKENISNKSISKIASKLYNVSKKELYNKLIEK